MPSWLGAGGPGRYCGPAAPVTRGRPAPQLHRYARTIMYSPVLTIIAWLVAIAFLRPREGNAHRAKTPSVAVPSYSGPILIRGLALDASRRALLFSATGAGPRNGLELQAPQAPAPSLWSFWASSMWVPGPGCYGVQIDTLGATDVVVFEAQ
jgi:hypothetical protein